MPSLEVVRTVDEDQGLANVPAAARRGNDLDRLSTLDSHPDTHRSRPRQQTLLHSQPLKGIIVTAWIVSCLILAPWWALKAVLGYKPIATWPLSTSIAVPFIRRVTHLCALVGFHTGGRDLSVVPKGLKHSEHVWIDPIAEDRIEGFIKEAKNINQVQTERVAAFWYPRRPPSTSEGKRNVTVALALHGGAYILGTAYEGDSYFSRIPRGLVKAGYDAALAVDYRLATAHPFPAQLFDALAAYAYLVESCSVDPSNITVSGDSAGANLALALVRYLRDTKVLPMPGALVLLSPFCDPTFSYRQGDGSFTRNYNSDIVSFDLTPYAVRYLLGSLPDATLHSPFISPITSPETRVFQDVDSLFVGFPSTFIAISEAERLFDEAIELRTRMEACGVDVTFYAEREAVHDWIQFGFMKEAADRTLKALDKWRNAASSHADDLNSVVVNV